MEYLIAAKTDIGNTKQSNQDSYNIKVISIDREEMVFAVLCDGMGGLAKGEVASATLVSAFGRWVENRLPALYHQGINEGDICREWTGIINEYNAKIKNYGEQYKCSLGTTVTAMLLTSSKYYILNIGDTRAYEIYDSVRVLTRDQTVIAREVELGNVTEEQAQWDPRRNVLLQCVGVSDMVYPDLFFGNTAVNAVYMLCSDGFRHEITPEEIYAYMQPDVMGDSGCMGDNMNSLILLNKQRQERDNITVLAIRTF